MKRFFLKTVIASVALAAFGMASAQDVKERTIKFATQNPEGHPIVAGMKKFGELVTAKSGGKIKVNLFPGGVLGGDGPNVSALQGGTLEMMSMNAGILASQAKEFAVFDFPFMFASSQEADAVVDGPFGKMMLAKLDPKNIHGLAYWELGFRNITNSRRPINKVEDIAGLKLRVIPNAINVDWVSALGANPTPLAFPEVYAAMEQKAIDGHENPFSVINANKFFEVQKHLVLSRHMYSAWVLLMSKKAWDGLSAQEQKIVQDAAREATVYERKTIRAFSETALGELKKAGMQITELPAAEQAKLRAKLQPVLAKYGKEFGEATTNELMGELTKVRGGK